MNTTDRNLIALAVLIALFLAMVVYGEERHLLDAAFFQQLMQGAVLVVGGLVSAVFGGNLHAKGVATGQAATTVQIPTNLTANAVL